jgi:NAD(P)H-hydrate epimerase
MTIENKLIKSIYKKRNENSHKGTYGHAILIAGSKNKMGAALIASKACLRSGVGLLTVLISKKEKSTLTTFLPEAMVHFRNQKINFSLYNTLGIGPGLGTDKQASQLVFTVLKQTNYPIVVDADALNILSQNKDWFLELPQNSVLTPHPKEFDRLFGEHHSTEERKIKAITKAKELDVVIVLKGHETFITNGENSYTNTTGNSGLAKGGSGDALTGIITAFIAQKYTPIQAAILGVFMHGLAADLTLKSQSVESMLITDVIENLGNAFKSSN